jgi:PAS domain S-box-containing protein
VPPKATARSVRDPPAARASQPTAALLHELQVHQIELELQNEELRRTQAALEVSRDRFVDLFDFAPVGYLTLSDAGLIEEVNLTGAALLGVERGELRGKRFVGFVTREHADRWNLFFKARDQRTNPQSCPLLIQRADGSVFDAHLVCHWLAPGRPEAAVRVALTDVSESRRLEQALWESAARLSHVLAGSNDGFWDWDVPSGRVRFSGRWASMLGYELAELEPILATWERLIHPEDRLKTRASVDAHLRGETELFEHEHRARHKDGRWVWILDRGKVVERDPDGNPLRMAGTHTDVTERKLSEEALRDSERWLRVSQEIARIGHYVFDVKGNHWTSSGALNAIFGIDDGFPRTAANWIEIVHPDDRVVMEAYLADLLVRGSRFDQEYRVIDQASGEVRWVHGLGHLQRAPDGEPVQLVGTIQDVTSRRKAEAERNGLQAQLALQSRLAAMGTLVAGVAHEINNPLAAELAGQGIALELARGARTRRQKGERLDPEVEVHVLDQLIEALEDAQEGGQRVARIVKDMAAFGSPDLRRTRVRLADAVADAMRWLPASVAQVATVAVEIGVAPDVMAAAGQIKQVVVNLVTNAAKATRPGKRGEIVVRIGQGPKGTARLEVVDDGTGIEPAIRARIFEPFFTTRQVGEGRGSGLGLAVCHAIATSHGGTLTVESVEGKGSTFRMELPAAPTEDR